MTINSVIPSPIFETLRDSEDTLRTTLAELAEDTLIGAVPNSIVQAACYRKSPRYVTANS